MFSLCYNTQSWLIRNYWPNKSRFVRNTMSIRWKWNKSDFITVLMVQEILDHCEGDIYKTCKIMAKLWWPGYAAEDIIGNGFLMCERIKMLDMLKHSYIYKRQQRNACEDCWRTVLAFANIDTFGQVVLGFVWVFLSLMSAFK